MLVKCVYGSVFALLSYDCNEASGGSTEHMNILGHKNRKEAAQLAERANWPHRRRPETSVVSNLPESHTCVVLHQMKRPQKQLQRF